MISFSHFLLLEGQLEDSLMRLGASKEDAKKAISRWRNLNDAQREKLPNPQKYTKKNGNTFEDFLNDLQSAEEFVSKTAKQKQVKQSGIKGLVEGEDYIELETGDPDLQAYAPLNYEASKLIASKDVGSCEGKWCVAYQKSPQHWDEYIEIDGGVLIYFITPETKYAAYYRSATDYELFDPKDNKLANSPIDDLVAELGKKFDELRENFSPSFKEIIQTDDADSYEEKYKQDPEGYSINAKGHIQMLISSRADQCFDWVIKNVPLENDVIGAGILAIVNTEWNFMNEDQEEYDSPAMKDRFMKLVNALPDTISERDKKWYEMVSLMGEYIAVNLNKSDFYFDVVLNDDRFYFEGSDFREGTIDMWDGLLDGYADPDHENTIKAIEKLKKREKKAKEDKILKRAEFRTRLLGNID